MWSLLFVCHSFSLWAGLLTKVISRFHWNLVLWLAYQLEELIHFLVLIWCSIQKLDHFLLPPPMQNRGFLDLLAFLIQSPTDFHDTQRNDWCWQRSESTTFWERSGDMWIQILINPEIWIKILDHFRFRLDALPWQRFVLSEHRPVNEYFCCTAVTIVTV